MPANTHFVLRGEKANRISKDDLKIFFAKDNNGWKSLNFIIFIRFTRGDICSH